MMVVVVVAAPVVSIAAVTEVTEVTEVTNTTPETCMAYEPGVTAGATQAASAAYEAASATSKTASSRIGCQCLLVSKSMACARVRPCILSSIRCEDKIIRLAEIFNIAVVITNQVQTSPDTFFGDPTKAAGGNIIAHSQDIS